MAAHLWGCWVLPMISRQHLKRFQSFHTDPTKGEKPEPVETVDGTHHSPEHSNRGFSAEIMHKSTIKVMCHDMDTSSLKPGHAHQVRSESITATPPHHCDPPQASRTVRRTSEVISPMSHRTDIS